MDISRLSETMAYAQMFTIVTKPAENGPNHPRQGHLVSPSRPHPEGLYYHFLVVADMQACCEIGVEFFRMAIAIRMIIRRNTARLRWREV